MLESELLECAGCGDHVDGNKVVSPVDPSYVSDLRWRRTRRISPTCSSSTAYVGAEMGSSDTNVDHAPSSWRSLAARYMRIFMGRLSGRAQSPGLRRGNALGRSGANAPPGLGGDDYNIYSYVCL